MFDGSRVNLGAPSGTSTASRRAGEVLQKELSNVLPREGNAPRVPLEERLKKRVHRDPLECPAGLWSHRCYILIFLFIQLTVLSSTLLILPTTTLVPEKEDEVEVAAPINSTHTTDRYPSPRWIQKYSMVAILLGALLTSFFGGYVAQRAGHHTAMSVSGQIGCLLGLSIVATSQFYKMDEETIILSTHFVTGAIVGMYLAAYHVVVATWSTVSERTFASFVAFIGFYVGFAFDLYISSRFIWDQKSWLGVYTIGLGLLVCISTIYRCTTEDDPFNATQISQKEGDLLESYAYEVNRRPKISTFPIKEIFSSSPFWAYTLVDCAYHVTLVLFFQANRSLITDKEFPQGQVADDTCLSVIAVVVIGFFGSITTDYGVKRYYISLTSARKIGICVGLVGSSIALFYLHTTRERPIYAMVGFFGFLGYVLPQVKAIPADLSATHAGSVSGLSNLVALGFGVLLTYTPKFLMAQGYHPWPILALSNIILQVVTSSIFLYGGSSEIQKWNVS